MNLCRSLCTAIVVVLLPGAGARAPAAQVPAWHQHVKYQIEAEVDTSAQKLRGYLTFAYKNNSPDSLRRLFFQIPVNAFLDEENTAVREMRRFSRGGVSFSATGGKKLTITSLQLLAVGTRTRFPIQAFDFSDTILNLPLPVPLAPGDSLSLGIGFEQDYAKVFKRYKRRGRPNAIHLEFVDWFPRVAVYNRDGWQVEPFHFLMESSDVFNDFAEIEVTLQVPGHWIVAAPGTLLSGDPGWAAVRADTAQTDSAALAWHDSLTQALSAEALKTGPRRVRYRVPKAHNFIWSTSPDYIHYAARAVVPVHLLARGAKNRHWEKHLLAKLDSLLVFVQKYFGPPPFEQLVLVESNGASAEHPGMLIGVDEDYFSFGYSYAKMLVPGMVSVNGVQESWISKGLALYVAKKAAEWRYGERGYEMDEAQEDMNWLERNYPLPSLDQALRSFSMLYMESGQNEAIAQKINQYKDPVGAGFNLYLKSELFYEMLEYVVGPENLRRIIRQLVHQYRFQAISERTLQAVSESVSGQDLDTFFRQWLHGTPTVDYAKGKVKQYREGDSTWVTEVNIQRRGDGIMPVDVEIEANGKKLTKRWDGKAAHGKVVFRTGRKPRRIRVDPRNRILDTNMLNNGRRRLEIRPDLPLLKMYYMPVDAYLVLWRPLLGYNHVDGPRLGIGTRGSYRAYFNNLSVDLSFGLKSWIPDARIAYSHPLRRRDLLSRYEIAARRVEGRYEFDSHVIFKQSGGILTSSSRSLQLGANYSGVLDRRYTLREVANDTGKISFHEWDDRDIFAAYAQARWRTGGKATDLRARFSAEQALPGGDAQFTKLSGRLHAELRWQGLAFGVRTNAGTTFNNDDVPAQDRFYADGASPRERFRHNVARTGRDWLTSPRRYVEGGGYLRGYAGRRLAVDKYTTLNVELGLQERKFGLKWFAFYDAGRIWPVGAPGSVVRVNAGLGATLIGAFQQFFGGNIPLFESLSARLYFPIWVSDPLPGEKQTQFRWYFALGRKL